MQTPHWLGGAVPLLQAPMAGSSGLRLAQAIDRAGGLAALPCALRTPAQVAADVSAFRAGGGGAINLNFFCHAPPIVDAAAEAAWAEELAPFGRELGVTIAPVASSPREPFDDAMCAMVEATKPEIVSFHFGLPAPDLLARVRATGARILASATTVEEGVFLAAQGCDAVIAQGIEAGGHRGHFLSHDLGLHMPRDALIRGLRQVIAAPIVAAGRLMSRPDIAAAFAAGANAVQLGTALLRSPEADTSALHRTALAGDEDTAVTNLFTGRPARGIINRKMRVLGPLRPDAPPFPRAALWNTPLRAAAEARGLADMSALWAGAGYREARAQSADEIVRDLFG